MRTRADRRHSEKKAKSKARILVDRTRDLFPPLSEEEMARAVGKGAAVHNAYCSCPACGNPRRHFSEKTIQEKRQDLPDA